MNATEKRLFDALSWASDFLHNDPQDDPDPEFADMLREVRDALAAAKEEQGKHEICPPHVIYEAVGGGMICSGCEQRFAAKEEAERKVMTDEEIDRLCLSDNSPIVPRDVRYGNRQQAARLALRYARDNGYLAPAKGLDVERVMGVVEDKFDYHNEEWADEELASIRRDKFLVSIRKALEAHAEKEAGNLRTDPWISVGKELPPISESDQEEDYVLVLWYCADCRHSPYKTQKARRAICDHDDEGTPLWFWVDEIGDPIDDDDNLIVAWSRIVLPSPPDTDKG